jgi:hypothetical protein
VRGCLLRSIWKGETEKRKWKNLDGKDAEVQSLNRNGQIKIERCSSWGVDQEGGGSRSRRCSSSILKSQWADLDRGGFDLGVKIEKGKIEEGPGQKRERYKRDVAGRHAPTHRCALAQKSSLARHHVLTSHRHTSACRCLCVPFAASSCYHTVCGDQWSCRVDSLNGSGRRWGDECLVIVLRLPSLEDLGRMGIDMDVAS